MTASERVELIKSRLIDAFHPDYLEVLDESDQHIGHAGHQGGGRHFAIIIGSAAFNNMSRVEAHRQLYALFTDMMPEPIHALRLQIRKVD